MFQLHHFMTWDHFGSLNGNMSSTVIDSAQISVTFRCTIKDEDHDGQHEGHDGQQKGHDGQHEGHDGQHEGHDGQHEGHAYLD